MAQISATEFMTRLQSGEKMNLLDVREELEYATFNIGGNNVPLSTFPASIQKLIYNKTDEIIVMCKIGMRSETVRRLLIENGFQNVHNLAGGLIALQKLDQ